MRLGKNPTIRKRSHQRTAMAAPVTVAAPPSEDFTTTLVGGTKTGKPELLVVPMTLVGDATKQGSTLAQTGGCPGTSWARFIAVEIGLVALPGRPLAMSLFQ